MKAPGTFLYCNDCVERFAVDKNESIGTSFGPCEKCGNGSNGSWIFKEEVVDEELIDWETVKDALL